TGVQTCALPILETTATLEFRCRIFKAVITEASSSLERPSSDILQQYHCLPQTRQGADDIQRNGQPELEHRDTEQSLSSGLHVRFERRTPGILSVQVRRNRGRMGSRLERRPLPGTTPSRSRAGHRNRLTAG